MGVGVNGWPDDLEIFIVLKDFCDFKATRFGNAQQFPPTGCNSSRINDNKFQYLAFEFKISIFTAGCVNVNLIGTQYEDHFSLSSSETPLKLILLNENSAYKIPIQLHNDIYFYAF